MDYELGQEKLSWQYWEAVENGKSLDDFRIDNPLFDGIKTHLGQPNLLRS